jgi:linoleoyl-CoA desaturase
MINNPPTFSKQDSLKFFRTLNSRVNNYFKENKIEKNGKLVTLKTVILLLFLVPYFIIISLTTMPIWFSYYYL